jgi:hypothetical protein
MAMHRMREGFVEQRTALVNRLRSLLAEFGIFLPQGIDAFRARFVEALEDATNEMNDVTRTALLRGWEHWQVLDQQVAWSDAQVAAQVKEPPGAADDGDRRHRPPHSVGCGYHRGRRKPVRERSPTGRLARRGAEAGEQRRQNAAGPHH